MLMRLVRRSSHPEAARPSVLDEEELMSSAGIAIAPSAVVAAAGAALLLTGTAAVLIAVRGANMAAEAALDMLDQADAYTDARLSARRAGADARPGWERIAAEVAQVNARIVMLSERLARAGTVTVALPTPLSLVGCTRAAAQEWVGETVRAVQAAQQSFETAVAADEARKTAERLGGSAASAQDAAVVAAYQERLSVRQAVGAAVADGRLSVVADQTVAVLDALDLEADERERRDVLAAAALLARHQAHSASSYLTGLRQTVESVNRAVARRRVAALRLAALDGALAADIEPRGPLQGAAVRLRAVVAGEQELTPLLFIESARSATYVEEVVRQRFLLEVVRERLAAYGCAVQTEYDMEHSASLRVTREEWSGEHFADVWIDRDGNVRSELLRLHPLADEQAAERERCRCVEHDATISAIGAELGGDVDVDDAHRCRFGKSAY